jgi:threonine synthase
MDAAAEFGWYNRNCAINAYLVEGKKTCGLEVGEQLQDDMADWLAVAVGDGCTIAGIWKGLMEMKELGVLNRLPRLLGVQAEGAAPIYESFSTGQPLKPVPANTLADSIAVGQPRNTTKALRAVKDSGGAYVKVSDDAILSAIPRLARATGVFAEPAGVTSLAGVLAARESGLIGPKDRVIIVATGNGLKDIKSAQRTVGKPHSVAPAIEDVRAALNQK